MINGFVSKVFRVYFRIYFYQIVSFARKLSTMAIILRIVFIRNSLKFIAATSGVLFWCFEMSLGVGCNEYCVVMQRC